MTNCRLPLRIATLLSVLLVTALVASAAGETTEWAARHILVSYTGAQGAGAARSAKDAKGLAAQVAAEAKAPGADFAALAQRYSDDKGTGAQGGFLGYFPRGKMTPKFQEAVEALAEGQVSDVVETPFGFHVIQRLPRAEADALLDKTRSAVVVAIFPWKGVSRDPTVSRAKDLALDDATRAMEHLKAGGSFETIPPVLGATPFVPGWQTAVLPLGQVVPAYKALGDAAFAVPLGGVSTPVETPRGYAVLRRVAYFRMQVQHLVVLYKGCAVPDTPVTRSKTEARARAEEALKRYEANPSAWKAIVAEFSDEPEAGPREGDLGVHEPGSFVAAFDAGIAPLKVGEHTKVFETPYGFHVARRVP